jgi:hypothetical protein
MISKRYSNSFLKETVSDYLAKQNDNPRVFDYSIIENKDFGFVEFSSDHLIDCKSFNLKKVVYFFELDENDEACEIICNTIKTRKKATRNQLKLPKVNFQNLDTTNKILYVGKSSGPFSERLKQHFGEGSEKSYALHLNKWNDVLKLKTKLKLFYISFEGALDEKDKNLLEMLEASLHDKLKPILGIIGH